MVMMTAQAVRIIQQAKGLKHHSLAWFAGQHGTIKCATLNPNEKAHSDARCLTDRAPSNSFSPCRSGHLLVQRDLPTLASLKKTSASATLLAVQGPGYLLEVYKQALTGALRHWRL